MNNILCQRIGIYARLSVRNTEREEMSIENQLLLVGQYLDQHTECQQRKVYVDYGYSGTNFQRPEFQQMIEDAKAKKIDLILTIIRCSYCEGSVQTGERTSAIGMVSGILLSGK